MKNTAKKKCNVALLNVQRQLKRALAAAVAGWVAMVSSTTGYVVVVSRRSFEQIVHESCSRGAVLHHHHYVLQQQLLQPSDFWGWNLQLIRYLNTVMAATAMIINNNTVKLFDFGRCSSGGLKGLSESRNTFFTPQSTSSSWSTTQKNKWQHSCIF